MSSVTLIWTLRIIVRVVLKKTYCIQCITWNCISNCHTNWCLLTSYRYVTHIGNAYIRVYPDAYYRKWTISWAPSFYLITSDVTHWSVRVCATTSQNVHVKVSYIKQVSYIHKRGGIYQYIQRIPYDIRSHYKTNQLYFSLRTGSFYSANRLSKFITK